MNVFLRISMAAAIALASGSAWAQAAYTGKNVLNDNTNQWQPPATGPVVGNAEVNASTGTFHAGGVAACDGCHVMHNAKGGVARSTRVAPWTNAVPAFLLQGSDQSSTCLICHGDPGANDPTKPYVIAQTGGATAAATMNYSPGGDFGWLIGTASRGERSGHNVVALDFGIAADQGMRVAPGGTFPVVQTGVAAFACSNCHDPHGRYRMELDTATTWKWTGPVTGNGVTAITQPIYSSGSYGNPPKADAAVGAYRLLAGYGYSPASAIANPLPFANNPPVAVAPTGYNHVETAAAGGEVRVAYGSGMSEWCQNCHTNIHMDNYTSGAMGATGLKHPAGNNAVLKPGQFTVYNSYVSSGKFTGTANYTSLVPFENARKISRNLTDLANLRSAATGGADAAGIFVASAQSNVMCLSCHRAHASAFDSMIRWNMDDTFITNATSLVDTQGRGGANAAVLRAGYYGRGVAELGQYQRSMCNKCHGKD
jgi:predicted CXXCH cytochrome family protein